MTPLAPTKFKVPLKPRDGGGIMTDRVIPLPSRLERAAVKIKKAITKCLSEKILNLVNWL